MRGNARRMAGEWNERDGTFRTIDRESGARSLGGSSARSAGTSAVGADETLRQTLAISSAHQASGQADSSRVGHAAQVKTYQASMGFCDLAIAHFASAECRADDGPFVERPRPSACATSSDAMVASAVSFSCALHVRGLDRLRRALNRMGGPARDPFVDGT
jgi:hypothetical protein